MDQIVDPSTSQRKVNEAHWRVPVESFCNCSYDYARGVTTVYFYCSVNRKGMIYATAVHSIDIMKLLKDVYLIVLLYDSHLHRSVEMGKNKDGMKWAVQPLHMR